jgi:hypothetical protein
MLIKKYDYTIAEFAAENQVIVDELEQADLITIRGYVPGGIYHSKEIRWRAHIGGLSDPLDILQSKKERKEIEANRQYFESQGYQFEVKKVTQELFDEFAAIYSNTVGQKKRFRNINLLDQILSKSYAGFDNYIIGMFKEKELISGLAFFIKDGSARVSVGAKQKFTEVRGGVGGVLEVELLNFCHQHQIAEISHGQSTNPSGIIDSAGVFEFKSRYGFSAYPENYWVTTFIRNAKVALSDLVFVTVIGERIGYLVVSKLPEREVVNKYRTREVDGVKVQSFADAEKAAQEYIQHIRN